MKLGSALVLILILAMSATAQSNSHLSSPSSTVSPSTTLPEFAAEPLTLDSGTSLLNDDNPACSPRSASLVDELTQQAIPPDTKKLVILIHGWNPGNVCDMYGYASSPDWAALRNALQVQLRGSDWKLVLYHWEQGANGANTGDVFDCDWITPCESGPLNATQAATNAFDHHGPHLATLLMDQAEHLEQVQFIAHSAGSWVAREAARDLLVSNPTVKVQMTLLDPFIPDVLGPELIGGMTTGLNYAKMISTATLPGNARMFRLENYCANDTRVDPYGCDSAGLLLNPLDPTATGTVATPGGTSSPCEPFVWRSGIDIDQQVDWGSAYNIWGNPIAGVAEYYDCHSGPVRFYANTVDHFNGYGSAALANFNLANVGWAKSLFYREKQLRPAINGVSPSALTTSPSPQLITISGTNFKTLGDPNASQLVFHDPANVEYVRTPTSATTTSLQYGLNVGQAAGVWTVSVRNSDVESQPFSFSVATAGAELPAPSSLAATAVSSTRIDLEWSDRSSTETGFRVERLAPSGSWSEITTRGQNVTYFSDTNCAPATFYQYRVRAYNQAGYSAYSNVASATTAGTALAEKTLQLRSSNPSSGVQINTWIGNGQFASSATPTSTTRPTGSIVGVGSPATLPSGFVFRKWMLNGIDYDYSNPTSVLMNADLTLTAIYGPTPSPTRVLVDAELVGPDEVDERSTTRYTAVATYNDGYSEPAPANWDSSSSYGTFSAPGVLDASAVTSDREIEISATVGYYGTVLTATKNVTIRNTDVLPTYTLNRSALNGSISRSPSMSAYPSGTEVRLNAYPDDGYLFSHWSGDASGTSRTTYITMNSNKSVTANFVPDLSEGTVRVYIDPAQANVEGAGWKAQGNGYYPLNYTPSGDSHTLDPGRYYVHYKPIPDWVEPDQVPVDVVGGVTSTIYGTYRELKGSLQVTITPEAARSAGARWRIDNGPWLESGTTLSDVETGNHNLQFQAVAGWGAPGSRVVAVERNKAKLEYGDYEPPLGLPLITSISPSSGPLPGGTAVTIQGANFEPETTVTFDGVAATAVTVESPSELTATTPAHASYGSVPVAVTSNGQTATRSNGFAYLNASGANIELVAQIGGNVEAVGVVGNIVYYGEGPGLVVSDFTNSASPIERGRVALPSTVKGIDVVGGFVFAAVGTAGLYSIDVSDPTAPSIVGFYDTDGSAVGVDVLDGVAYVADSNAGLAILDIEDPEAITLLGAIDTAGRVESVSAGHIGAETYAFVGEGDLALRAIQVTTPNLAAEIDSVPAQSSAGIEDLKLVGSVLYVVDWQAGVKIFDASDPSALTQIGSRDNTGASFLDVVGNRLYTSSSFLQVWDLTKMPTPEKLGQFTFPGGFLYDLVVGNGLAFAAMGRDGLQVASVGNPTSISLRSVLRTIGGVEDVYLVGDTLLVGNTDGLQTVDVSNPLRPVWLATLSGDRVTDIVAGDGKATLVNYGDEEVRVANVTNPVAPSVLGQYGGVQAWSVALRGANPLLAAATPNEAHNPKLDVLNLSNPALPQSLGSTILGDESAIADGIIAGGNWAFVGVQGAQSRVSVVDLSNPASPQTVGSVPLPSRFRELAVSSDLSVVYAPLSPGGVGIVDVETKASPTFLSAIDPPQIPGSSTQTVEVLGDRLYADDSGHLVAFDIEAPRSPVVIGYYDIPGTSNGLTARDDLVFVAGGNAGVTILRVLDVDSPTVAITTPTANPTHETTDEHIALGGVASDNTDVARVVWNNDRGGGGTAEGTGSWSIPDIELGSGINRITVTAEDGAGNHGSDVLEVTATFPDTTPPVVAITGPKPDAEFSVETETIELSGSVADNEEVVEVGWANDRGGAGVALLANGAWSVSEVPLELGPNLLTVTAIDAAGNETTDSAVIFMAPPDIEPPTITIDFPTPNAELYVKENMLNVSGTAFDNVGVSGIDWAAGEEVGGSAEGTSPWFVNDIPLEAGLNVIDVTAYDTVGNSSTDSLAVTFDPCPGADADGNCSESFNEATKACNAPDPNDSPCDDGVFCNGVDTCSAGTCSNHAGNPCSLGTECADACNEAADNCFDVTGTPCSADASPCTLDQCDGLGACVHPAGNSGAVCRPAAGACDVAETCTGTSSSCPADSLAASTAVCRAAAGVCDVQETCTGTTISCPVNAFASSTTVCRSAGGVCDIAEHCSGSSASCPADVLVASTSVCRPGVGECDLSESCSGASKTCPVNSFVANGVGCSTDSNICTDDVCNGAGACTHSANSAPCNDGLFCNGADTCSGGACSSHAGSPCPGPDNDENCAESCSEVTDSCTAPDPDATACNDGDPCTKDDTCTTGTCAGVPGDGCGTTTTTVPADPCGDPNGDGKITASDALATLGAAVGTRECAIWICDFNGDEKVSAADALGILRVAVGQEVLPQCPDADFSNLAPATTVPTTAPAVSITSTTIDAAP